MATVGEGRLARPIVPRGGFRTQVRVVGALIMRDLHSRYGRENVGYLWLILEPMLLATMIGLIHSRSATQYGSDIKPVPMSLVGYCNFMTFRSIVSRSEGALESSAMLFYHRTISVFDVLLARAMLEQAGTFMAMMILLGLATAFGISNPPERPLVFMAAVFLMFWICFNMSMIIAAITHERRAIGRLVHPIVYILMPLSGCFFMLEAMPGPIREVMLYIPLAHIFELLRYGWFRSATPQYIDVYYLGGWILASMLIGLLLISDVRKRIQTA